MEVKSLFYSLRYDEYEFDRMLDEAEAETDNSKDSAIVPSNGTPAEPKKKAYNKPSFFSSSLLIC